MATTYISGLDLGQMADHSALITCEVTNVSDPDHPGQTVPNHGVRHIYRWPLGTPYPTVIADLKLWYSSPPLAHTSLVVDGTGVGVAIVDMIRSANLSADVHPFTITAGHQEGDGTVPKKDIIFATIAALQTRRLQYAEDLLLRPVLEKELETYRVKVTPDRGEVFAAWREKDHDDLVFALALAVWFGERFGGPVEYVKPKGPTDPFYRLPPWTFR